MTEVIPTILATLRNGSLEFPCPHCRTKHLHGVGGGAGHRTAHCWWTESPYIATGYYLELSPEDAERLRVIELGEVA